MNSQHDDEHDEDEDVDDNDADDDTDGYASSQLHPGSFKSFWIELSLRCFQLYTRIRLQKFCHVFAKFVELKSSEFFFHASSIRLCEL